MCPLRRFAFCCPRSTGDEPKKKKHRTKKKKKSAKKHHDSAQKAEDGAASAASEKTENDTEDMEVNEGAASNESDNDGNAE